VSFDRAGQADPTHRAGLAVGASLPIGLAANADVIDAGQVGEPKVTKARHAGVTRKWLCRVESSAAARARKCHPPSRSWSALINELTAGPDPDQALLVLDEYHLIDSEAVHSSLGFLLAHRPPELTR
jgi:hypothetical protein